MRELHLGWEGGGGAPATALLHSQDGDDLHEVKGHAIQLSNEHRSHTLEQRRPVHVDRGADGQDEPADVFGHAVLLFYTLHHQRQCGRADGGYQGEPGGALPDHKG